MTNDLASPFGDIPQSKALTEANPGSLNELFNRDPEGLSDGDIDRIIEVMRAQRERFAQAEAQGTKRPKPTQAPATNLLAKDLGL